MLYKLIYLLIHLMDYTILYTIPRDKDSDLYFMEVTQNCSHHEPRSLTPQPLSFLLLDLFVRLSFGWLAKVLAGHTDIEI